MSTNILHIETSPLGPNSVTRSLGSQMIGALKAQNPDARIVTRDLAATPLPHLDSTILGAFFTPADKQSPEQKALLASSDAAIAELFTADTIVIEAPMWNFGIPSVLKAWIDHISRAGKTFKYTETGPVGLVPSDKKVIVISSRGGIYSEGPAKPMDHQESYLQAVLGFMGLTQVSFVRAEGVNLGAEMAEKAKAAAVSQIHDLAKNAA